MVIKQSIIAAWLSLSISFISAIPIKQVLIVKKNKQMISVTFDDVSLGSEKDAALFKNLLDNASRCSQPVMVMNEHGFVDDDLKQEGDESFDEIISSYAESEEQSAQFSNFFDILASNKALLPGHVSFIELFPVCQNLWEHVSEAFEHIDACIEFENATDDGEEISTTLPDDIQRRITFVLEEGEDPGLEHYFEAAYLKFLKNITFKGIEDTTEQSWKFVEQLQQLQCPALNDYIAQEKKACLDHLANTRKRLLSGGLTEKELAKTPLISLYFHHIARENDDEDECQDDWRDGDVVPLQAIALEYVFSKPLEAFRPLLALNALAHLYDKNCPARVTVNLPEVYAEQLVELLEMIGCKSFVLHEKTGQSVPIDAYNWMCERKKDDEKQPESQAPKTGATTKPFGFFNSFDEWLQFDADSTCVVM